MFICMRVFGGNWASYEITPTMWLAINGMNKKKRVFVSYSTDRDNEVNKMFVLTLAED